MSKPTKTAVTGEDHIRTASAVNGEGVISEQKLHRIRLEAAKHIQFFLNHPVTENIINVEWQVVLAAAIIYKFYSSVSKREVVSFAYSVAAKLILLLQCLPNGLLADMCKGKDAGQLGEVGSSGGELYSRQKRKRKKNGNCKRRECHRLASSHRPY